MRDRFTRVALATALVLLGALVLQPYISLWLVPPVPRARLRASCARLARNASLRQVQGGPEVTCMTALKGRIRTLALSELPDQDCCTLLTPRHVETQARIDDLRRIEARLEAADLAEELAGLAQEYRPDRP